MVLVHSRRGGFRRAREQALLQEAAACVGLEEVAGGAAGEDLPALRAALRARAGRERPQRRRQRRSRGAPSVLPGIAISAPRADHGLRPRVGPRVREAVSRGNLRPGVPGPAAAVRRRPVRPRLLQRRRRARRFAGEPTPVHRGRLAGGAAELFHDAQPLVSVRSAHSAAAAALPGRGRSTAASIACWASSSFPTRRISTCFRAGIWRPWCRPTGPSRSATTGSSACPRTCCWRSAESSLRTARLPSGWGRLRSEERPLA